MNQQTCNLAWLDAFLKNDLNQSEEQLLTSHLDECSDCREELENRAAEQSVWREASNLLGGSILLSTAAIGDIRSSTVRSPQVELVLKQLAPTDDPESLGRIGGYEVTGVVGSGGMGVVLKAHDRSLDRIVAIKVMSPHLASSGSARRRFAREAKAAAAVLHPNVIAIHSVASEDANPYLVMPYVRGASLQKRIDSQGPLPLKDTLRIGSQIAAGLAAAHEQGLVHRDIKPANILLEEGVERVTITDFGLARAVDDASMTCSGVIAGTPQYMSPEQTRGEPIDARSDLFSLGSVLYAMCAGRSPFRAETTYGVLHRIANDSPTPVCEVNSDVPAWLGHIINRLMAKLPQDRFESAAQVAELLEGCLAHVQQPTAIPFPVGVQALAAQAQLRAGEIPKPNRLKAIHQRIPPIGKFIAAAAGAIALFFAGVLIVLELDKGMLTIESEIDDVPIRIMQGDEVVKQLTVTKSGNSVRVAAGTYQIEIAGEFPLVSVANGIVSMKRGETETVTIAMTPPTTANTKREPVSSDLSPASTRLVADVIRQFNELQKSDPVGSKQPLLTDDEVIAAVRAMSREIASINVTESNYKVLRDTIERGQIPNEWTIESSNQFKLSDGRVGDRWTVQLSLRRGESSPQRYVFRSRYVKIEAEPSAVKLPMPEGNVSIAEWLAKVNAPDPNIYAPLPDLPVTEQEIVAALTDLIDQDQSTEFAPQRKALQEIIETRSLPKEAEISVFRPHRNRGYVSRWSNREGFENEDWTLRFEYPYMQGEKQIVTAAHLGFRSINSRPVDHVTDDEIHWGPVAQDGLQLGVAIEEVTLPDKSDLASTGAMAYKPHFYFRNPGKTDSTSIQLSDMYQHYEIDARTATGEQLPSKLRQGSYSISTLNFPDPLNGDSRIYKRACPFVVGTYVQTLFEDSLSLETPQSRPPVQPGKGFIYLELQRDPRAEKVNVAKGETDDSRTGQSYKIKLLVLASDDLKPVSGATVDVTLIRSDSGVTGDGGFAGFKTDEDGIATIDKSLWPGRYQIQVRAPAGSRFRDTEFSKDESILVVHEDGRYSPREFRLVVDDKQAAAESAKPASTTDQNYKYKFGDFPPFVSHVVRGPEDFLERVESNKGLSSAHKRLSPNAELVFDALVKKSQEMKRMVTVLEFAEALKNPPKPLTLDDYNFLYFLIAQAQQPRFDRNTLASQLTQRSGAVTRLSVDYKTESLLDDQVIDTGEYQVTIDGKKLYEKTKTQSINGKSDVEILSFDGDVVRLSNQLRESDVPQGNDHYSNVAIQNSTDWFFRDGNPARIMRLFDLKKRFGCNGKEESLAESVRQVVWEVPIKINGKETFAIGPLHDLHYIAPGLSYGIVRSERLRYGFSAELCRIEEATDYSLTEMSEFECPAKLDICLPRVITRQETISDKRHTFKTVIDKWEINEDVYTTRRESK